MSVIVCLVCESKTYRTNSKLCWCCEPNEPDPDLEICDGAFSAYCIAVPAALAAAQAAYRLAGPPAIRDLRHALYQDLIDIWGRKLDEEDRQRASA